jgi:hypothetical protein
MAIWDRVKRYFVATVIFFPTVWDMVFRSIHLPLLREGGVYRFSRTLSLLRSYVRAWTRLPMVLTIV